MLAKIVQVQDDICTFTKVVHKYLGDSKYTQPKDDSSKKTRALPRLIAAKIILKKYIEKQDLSSWLDIGMAIERLESASDYLHQEKFYKLSIDASLLQADLKRTFNPDEKGHFATGEILEKAAGRCAEIALHQGTIEEKKAVAFRCSQLYIAAAEMSIFSGTSPKSLTKASYCKLRGNRIRQSLES